MTMSLLFRLEHRSGSAVDAVRCENVHTIQYRRLVLLVPSGIKSLSKTKVFLLIPTGIGRKSERGISSKYHGQWCNGNIYGSGS